MKLRPRVVAAFAVLLAGGIGAAIWHKRRNTAAADPVTTAKAEVRTIQQIVTATGKIRPQVEVKITSEVYGEIVDLPFREGARVKKGDLIVRIKPDLYKAQVDAADAAVSMARSAALHTQAALVKAESDLRQYDDLHTRGLVSEADYMTYKTAYDTGKADLVSALANVDQAVGTLNQAKDSLTKTVILSPMDGTVSLLNSEVGESVVAQSSFTGTEIMRVADLGKMEAQVDVNENDIPNVKVGDHAELEIDAYPDRKFDGVVTAIGASSENLGATTSGSAAQSSNTSSDEVTNFLVKIAISDRDVSLRPGMSATANIDTQTVPNAVAVPLQCVTVRDLAGKTSDEVEKKRAEAGKEKTGSDMTSAAEHAAALHNKELLKQVVFVKVGDKVRMQQVETGISDDTWIEVKSGLKSGDEVVSGSYAEVSRKLKDGTAVRIEKPPEETTKKDGS